MITPKQAERCTTHHRACDCREYRFQRMEQALKAIYSLAAYESGCFDDFNPEKIVELCENALKEGQE